MFTGIIEEIGKMSRIESRNESMVLTLIASKVLEDVKMGDSIAVNGVCLTVVGYAADRFSVDVMPETYRKSSLKTLRPGDPVNLERAMQAGGRFGGHIVQGHVDGTGTIVSQKRIENAVVFTVRPSQPELFKYIIPQGSITIDGISLTVVDTASGHFTVSIIPHTLGETVLGYKQDGDPVNLECDILGKYIEHLLKWDRASAKPAKSSTLEGLLQENGFV